MEARKKVAREYSRISKHYEDFHQNWDSSIRANAASLSGLFDRYGLLLDARVVDGTCGAGTQVIGLADKRYDITGIDISQGQIVRCRHELKKRGLSARLIKGDFARISQLLTKKSYDAVISCSNSLPLLGSLPQIRRALRGSRQILKPGGLFVATFMDYSAVVKSRPRVLSSGGRKDPKNGTFRFWIEFGDWHADSSYSSRLVFGSTDDSSGKASARSYFFPKVHPLTYGEFSKLLRECGYKILSRERHSKQWWSYSVFVAARQ
jgi:glycine/sarcosine N-methyltransferase